MRPDASEEIRGSDKVGTTRHRANRAKAGGGLATPLAIVPHVKVEAKSQPTIKILSNTAQNISSRSEFISFTAFWQKEIGLTPSTNSRATSLEEAISAPVTEN